MTYKNIVDDRSAIEYKKYTIASSVFLIGVLAFFIELILLFFLPTKIVSLMLSTTSLVVSIASMQMQKYKDKS